MKIRVENLGYIHSGEVNLDRNLTVFIGKNQTGKTYLSNLIYMAYTRFSGLGGIDAEMKPYLERLLTLNALTINLEEFFQKHQESLDRYFSDSFSSPVDFASLMGLQKNLAEKSDFLKNAKIELGMDYSRERILLNLDRNYTQNLFSIHRAFHIRQDADNPTTLHLQIKDDYLYALQNDPDIKPHDIIFNIHMGLTTIITRTLLPKAYYQIAERLVFNEFYKSFEKDEMPHPYSPLPYVTLRYIDYLRYARIKESGFSHIVDYLEKQMLQGSVYQNDKGEYQYRMKDSSGQAMELPIQGTSSMVKSLASIASLIKEDLAPGTVLIIDEPEINLHPDNQYHLARVIAMLANAGVKVVVSTHSPTFLQEINNMMMLAQLQDGVEKDKVRKDFGYSPEMELGKDRVRAYLFNEHHQIEELMADEVGIVMNTIEKILHGLNQATNHIYYHLNEQIQNQDDSK